MRSIRILLWPFSLVYGFVTYLRNKCYDFGIFETYSIPKKSICVGNLNTGGTGKTPHVAYLASMLSTNLKTCILSRGYGRKTRGFILLNELHTSKDVGDEPLFYNTLFKDKVKVAVCEKRKIGIQKIQSLFPSNELIILDDAFQHRAVQAGFNILLTDYKNPFSKDLMLPAGNLREWRIGRNRADCAIVSNCPKEINHDKKLKWSQELKIDVEKLFFSSTSYKAFVPFGKPIANPENILLVTGIANPTPLINFLKEKYHVEHIQFQDHHLFSEQDIQQIQQKFDTFTSDKKIILTTEKDFMRLKDLDSILEPEKYPWYYQPIEIEIDKELEFKKLIDKYVNTI